MTPLSVYLVHWNAPEWCRSSVDSILQSQDCELSIAVVDNSDQRSPVLDSLLPPSVKIIRPGKNTGYAGGATIALTEWLRLDSEEYLVIGAHDLHVESGTLANLVDVASRFPHYGVLAPTIAGPVPSYGGYWSRKGATLISSPENSDGEVWDRDWVSGTCMLFRRACALEVRHLDQHLGSYCEDVEVCLRARDLGWRVGVVKTASAWGMGSRSDNSMAMIEANTIRLMLKREGLIAATNAAIQLLSWWLRTLVGAFAPWRPTSRRAQSRQYLRQHTVALKLLRYRSSILRGSSSERL